jgi:3-oxoacyl-[acyl-carrier protein] reductase
MVYVSSAAAGRPHPGQGYYAAAKQASEALYRNVGLELSTRGVTAVTLRPGYIDAGRGLRYLEKKADDALAKVPLGRALKIDEVVDAIMFLLSDSAVGFNATILTMDGGLSAGK